MKPAARTREETGLTAQINTKIVFFDVEQWLQTFSLNATPTTLHHLILTMDTHRGPLMTTIFHFHFACESWASESLIQDK